jgi:hypothetical protein
VFAVHLTVRAERGVRGASHSETAGGAALAFTAGPVRSGTRLISRAPPSGGHRDRCGAGHDRIAKDSRHDSVTLLSEDGEPDPAAPAQSVQPLDWM